jgi:uncharacterized protein involved in high-affinity Fe2+ transport
MPDREQPQAANAGPASGMANSADHPVRSRPVERPSDEADRHQLTLASQEGEAYHRSLLYMAHEVAHSGGMKRAGDYIVAYAQEKAEGMYGPGRDGALEWIAPEGENCHLEVSVSDAGDRRFIPGLSIEVVLKTQAGEMIGPFEMPFLWHPGLYHYGRNIKVPGDGRYTLSVRIAAPTFHRHDRINGRRYAEDVEVTFEDVDIKTGSE